MHHYQKDDETPYENGNITINRDEVKYITFIEDDRYRMYAPQYGVLTTLTPGESPGQCDTITNWIKDGGRKVRRTQNGNFPTLNTPENQNLRPRKDRVYICAHVNRRQN